MAKKNKKDMKAEQEREAQAKARRLDRQATFQGTMVRLQESLKSWGIDLAFELPLHRPRIVILVFERARTAEKFFDLLRERQPDITPWLQGDKVGIWAHPLVDSHQNTRLEIRVSVQRRDIGWILNVASTEES